MRRPRLMTLALTTTLIVLLAACGDDAGPAAPQGTGDPATGPSRIAFSSDREGNIDVFVVNPDGSELTQLTDVPGRDQHPTWSPDGARIAFSTEREQNAPGLAVMNADGSDQRVIVPPSDAGFGSGPQHPAWSPDGARIAFADGGGIFTVSPDGSDRQTVIDDDSTYRDLAWSPDGATLAYSSTKVGGDYEVFVMDVATGEETQLTEGDGFDGNPAWSPDGSTIAWSTNDQDLKPIGLMSPDGEDRRQLISGSISITGGATWSPDGSEIAYVSSQAGSSEIFAIAPGGTGKRQITEDADADSYDTAWSPAG